MNTQRLFILALCCATAGALGTAVRADSTHSGDDTDIAHFKIYGGAAYVAPMSDSEVTWNSFTEAVKAEKHIGWNLGFEGRFNRWFGVELDYVDANQDVRFGGTTIGDTNFSPLTATFNIHLVHSRIVDFYVGPSYSYVNWGDIHLNTTGRTFPEFTGSSDIGTDSSHGWGVSLGLDIGLGKHFAIAGGLKYLNVSLEPKGYSSIAVNPLVGRLGVAFRF